MSDRLRRRIAKKLRRFVQSNATSVARDPHATSRDGEVRGAIDVVHEGALFGWIADHQHQPVDSVDCTIDGDHVASVADFHFRQDLKDLGYGDGVLGFRVPLTGPLDGRLRTVRVHAFGGGRSLGVLTREIPLGQHPMASANPFLRLGDDRLPEGWNVLPTRRRELRVTRELGTDLPGQLDRYLRFSTHLEPGVEVGLAQSVHVDPALEHTAVIVARSVTGTPLLVRTAPPNGSATGAWEEIPLGGGWACLRVPYRATSPVAALEVTFGGGGHAVVDLACVALVPEPAARAEIPPRSADVPSEPERPLTIDDYVPRPERVLHGPEGGAELAPGWFFECSRGQELSFSALPADGAMAIEHEPLVGYSRVAVKCDRGALLSRPSLTIGFDVTPRDDRAGEATLLIIGRNADRHAPLWKKTVELPPAARSGAARRADLTAALSPTEARALRANAARFASLEVALELHAPYALVVHGLHLRTPERTARREPATSEPFESGFEDPVVAAQAASLIVPRAAPAAAAALHRVDVVVPVFNAAADVDRMLSSLIAANDGSYRVIVVDDASGPRTARLLDRCAAREPWVRLDRNDRNRGYTTSINRGVAQASAPYVVILNSDTVVPQGWHERLLAAFHAHPRLGIVGPLSNAASWQSVPHRFAATGDWFVNDIPGKLDVHAFQRWLERTWAPRRPLVPLLNGFCLAYRSEVFREVGSFDERTFPVGYGEENDFCLRAAAQGWELRVADDLYVYHAKSRSFQGRRAALTEAGNRGLRDKHPNADWQALTDALREHPDLKAVRDHVIQAFFGGVA